MKQVSYRDLLTQLVGIPSVSGNEKGMVDFVLHYLKGLGCRVTKQKVAEGRYNLFVEKGSGKKAILFYGHLDTVAPVFPDQWKTNPWKPSVQSGRLYGLGAYDMKAGIAAFVSAMARSDGYIKAFFAVDEENISEGAWAAVKERSEFFSDVELVISAEPNFGLGMNSLTVGRTGRCVFEVIFEGRPVHIAKYRDGVDAAALLGRFVDKLYRQREGMFHTTGSVVQVRHIETSTVGMSVCGYSRAEVEVLLSPEDSIERIQKKLSTLAGVPVRLKPRKTPYLSGYHNQNIPYRDVLVGVIKKHTGKSMRLVARTSVGDDNILASLGLPVITWGPDGGNAHSQDEFVDLDSVFALSTMYSEFLDKVPSR